VKKAIFFITCLSLSINAFAGLPKIGPGFLPGLGDGTTIGDGTTVGEEEKTGGGENTEVTLPVGLPVTGGDPAGSEPSSPSNIVYTFDLTEDNGAASVNQTHAAFEKARSMNAACVLIRINSFAGGWDVAENIRQEILGYDKPVMVYVNNQAVPAASFISSGADSIYTKKGSTLSNNKSKENKVQSKSISSDENSEMMSSVAINTNSSSSSEGNPEFSHDVTMNEILYKAGLGNLTVVEHDPGFSEKAIAFFMNPFVMMLVLLLTGFVMKKAVHSRLPGPVMYAMAFMLLLYLAPFQLAGLATGIEIAAAVALVVAVIASARYHKRILTGVLLVALTLVFTLIRTGDTTALMEYGSYSELLSLPAIPLGLVIFGWFLGRIKGGKTVSAQRSLDNQNEVEVSAAA